ncbi:adenine deaminase [Brevibacillus daliensis]|uniref:adenine deaminase n=1 Tax=Brevibacillus daliensis TaxID=2892995 RepID=UPI001E3C357E|nr:adenine deaminase [Brevibacillus daliensis]
MKNLQLTSQIHASAGRNQAELVLKNGTIINVFTGELYQADVAITNGMIVGIGKYEGNENIDVTGKYISPGFIDGHVHIESSMVTPASFANIVLPHGVTTVICDPHEIANVSGAAGIQYMLDSSEGLDLDVHVMLPSCVPSTSFENAGAILHADDLKPFYQHPRVLGLAEVMDYPAVLRADEDMVQKLADARNVNKKIDGHLAGLSHDAINVYMTAGIRTDHEAVTIEDAQARIRLGMYLLIREGSAAKDLTNLIPVVNDLTATRCLFCTDDKHLEDLLEEGSIDHNVRLAIQHGVDPVTAIRMATLTAAECYGFSEKGAVAPGYIADLLVLDNVEQVEIAQVYKNGKLIAKEGKMVAAPATVLPAPEALTNTVNNASVTTESLHIKLDGIQEAHVIDVIPNKIITNHLIQKVQATDGQFVPSIEHDLAKMVVIERHHATGHVGLGIVKGFTLHGGAIATTIAHDSHNIISVGMNDADILLAVQTLKQINGGLVVVKNGQILASLSLEISGLMTNRDVNDVLREQHRLDAALLEVGASQEFSCFLTLSFLALPVIPALKLTDMGLFDVEHFRHIDVTVHKKTVPVLS